MSKRGKRSSKAMERDKADSAEVGNVILNNKPVWLLSYADMPKYRKDNPSILTGYRQQMSFAGSLRSMFTWHNQTMNIWTHMIFVWACIGIMIYQQAYRTQELNGTWYDRIAMSFIILGGLATFFSSVGCHTFENRDEKAARFWHLMDYLGIVTVVQGSISYIFYFFYCDLILKIAYIAFTTICCIICAYVMSNRKFATHEYRAVRSLIFGGTWVSIFAPTMHFIIISGDDAENQSRFEFLFFILVGTLFCGVGCFFFVSRIPEKLCPSPTLDMIGQSHNLWHILNGIGAMFLYAAANSGFAYRQGTHGGTCP